MGRRDGESMIKVLIADDHKMFRQGLRMLFQLADAEQVEGEGGRCGVDGPAGQEAVELGEHAGSTEHRRQDS